MLGLLLYALVTSALYYLGARAKITSWLWTRYPPKLDAFMDCAACTGFWYGAIATQLIGRTEEIVPFNLGTGPIATIVVGLASIAFTPIMAGAMQAGLDRLGSIALPSPPEA